MTTEYGMNYPHWDCPKCDAPNAGAEQCNPLLHVGRKKRLRCDECGAVMIYRGDYGHDSDCGAYNFARITTVDGKCDHDCPVSAAETLLACGTIDSFDGVVHHDDAAEYLYTVTKKQVSLVEKYFSELAR